MPKKKVWKDCACGCGGQTCNTYCMGHQHKGRKPWNAGITAEDDPRILSGKNNPMYGTTRPDYVKEAVSKAHKGLKHTEETKKKISNFMSGPDNPNRGRKFTKEERKRISEQKSGRTWSEAERGAYEKKKSEREAEKETQRVLCECGCGELAKYGKRFIQGHHHRVRSEETRKNMSDGHIGQEAWNKGLTALEDDRILSGDNHSRWIGGVNPINNAVRTCAKYFAWRDAIFKRDDFTCQSCKERGVRLEAHHIYQFHQILIDNKIESLKDAEICSELWDVKNGITLCKKCHIEEHR